MKYETVEKLSEEKFKRYTGVKKETFAMMLEIIKEHEKATKKKIGGPPRLVVEDQLLVALAYWREYRTQDHLAVDFGVSQQTVGRIIRKIEDLLIKSGKFSLPVEPESETIIVVDVMESPIERPKK